MLRRNVASLTVAVYQKCVAVGKCRKALQQLKNFVAESERRTQFAKFLVWNKYWYSVIHFIVDEVVESTLNLDYILKKGRVPALQRYIDLII
ncbi:hypothetical protein JTE90_010869 [Oedothorax gibbosus]|uniref:Uncharacterized protein n=1 Tax=Oedothorax gibbosus TaxID=931172 RepID=A0AAV6V5Q3_9ARAC|nr:hypothetical protein JTE90_010869 [Oedothorax gibbosus]